MYLVVKPRAEPPTVAWYHTRYKLVRKYPITEQDWNYEHSRIVFGDGKERYELSTQQENLEWLWEGDIDPRDCVRTKPDFCDGANDDRCTDAKGKICYKLSNCCKNSHDWATEVRDGTVCK